MFKSKKLLLVTLLTVFSVGQMSAAPEDLSVDPTDIGGSLCIGGAGLALGSVFKHCVDTMTQDTDVLSNLKKLNLQGLGYNTVAGVASLVLGVTLQKATKGADYRKQMQTILSNLVGGYLLNVAVSGGKDDDSMNKYVGGGLALLMSKYLVSMLPAGGAGGSSI